MCSQAPRTPLLRIDPAKHGIEGVELYAKLEFCNPFGSVKDRIAWGMIRDDLPRITSRGQTLIEASSGNTAKALQVLAAMHGIRLRVLTNRTKVPEVRDALELLGGELEELPGLSECPDPTVPNDVFGTIEKLAAVMFSAPSGFATPGRIPARREGPRLAWLGELVSRLPRPPPAGPPSPGRARPGF